MIFWRGGVCGEDTLGHLIEEHGVFMVQIC